MAIQNRQRLVVFNVVDGTQRCSLVDRINALHDWNHLGSLEERVPVWQADSRHMTVAVGYSGHAHQLLFLHLDLFAGQDSHLSTVDLQPGVDLWNSVARCHTVFARHGALAAVQFKQRGSATQPQRGHTILIVVPATGAVLMRTYTTQQVDSPTWSWGSTHLALACCLVNVRDGTSVQHTERDRALRMEFNHDDSMLGFTSTAHDAIFLDVASGSVKSVLQDHAFKGFSGTGSLVLVQPRYIIDGGCKIWDLNKNEAVRSIDVHDPLPRPWLFRDRFILQRRDLDDCSVLQIFDAATGAQCHEIRLQRGPYRWPIARSNDECSLASVVYDTSGSNKVNIISFANRLS